nr:hypothetical protein [Salinibacter ruber]
MPVVEQVARDEGLEALQAQVPVEVRRVHVHHVVLVEPRRHVGLARAQRVDAHAVHGPPVVGAEELGRLVEPEAVQPALHHPGGVGVAKGEVVRVVARVGRGDVLAVAVDGAEHAVDEVARTGAERLLGELHVLVDGRVGRGGLEQQLVEPEPQDLLEPVLHRVVVPVVRLAQHKVEPPALPRDPRHQFAGLPAGAGVGVLDRQLVDESVVLAHPFEVVEGVNAGGRDGIDRDVHRQSGV